jgi:hypothetical protein
MEIECGEGGASHELGNSQGQQYCCFGDVELCFMDTSAFVVANELTASEWYMIEKE